MHGTKKNNKNTKPPNFLLYPLRLVKLPRLKEQIIENIKHFPFPLALMTGSYQIKRDACRRGERFGWQRDGVSEKGEGGRGGRTEIKGLELFCGGFLFLSRNKVGKPPPSSGQRIFLGKKHPIEGYFLGESRTAVELRLFGVFFLHKMTLHPSPKTSAVLDPGGIHRLRKGGDVVPLAPPPKA